MASGSNSGESIIVNNKENEVSKTTKNNEEEAKKRYYNETLPSSAPIKIPREAEHIVQHKNGYEQVKYKWKKNDYNYEARWHTRTPNAPKDQSDSWVISRHKLGVGYGPDARKSIIEINKK